MVFALDAGGDRTTRIFTNASRHPSCGLSSSLGSGLLSDGVLFESFDRNISTHILIYSTDGKLPGSQEALKKRPKTLSVKDKKFILQKSLTNIGKLRHYEKRETKGELAQLVEHYDGIVGVSGSSPLFSI